MRYYTIQNNGLLTADTRQALERFYDNVLELPTDYEEGKYIVDDGELVLNPDWEEEKEEQERQRLDALTLTPADVERALYKAKQMDFEDLKALIVQALPTVDIKALSIEFRAKDFYRGAMAGGMRLFDVVGALLGYTPKDMDYLFENKELPEKEEPSPEPTEEPTVEPEESEVE